MKAPPQCWIILFLFAAMRLFAASADLTITNVTRTSSTTLEISVSGSSTNEVTFDVSSDLRTWYEAGTGYPSASGAIELTGITNSQSQFFRAYVGPRDDIVLQLRTRTGERITDATAQVEVPATGHVFNSDSTGTVLIPTRLVPFATGFQVRVSAPGYVEQLVNLSPFTYFFAFNLEAQGPRPGDAPTTLSSVTLSIINSPILGTMTYTANLSGGSSGVFTIFGEAVGHGTYTYTPTSRNTAHLRLNYVQELQGDFDDLILTFEHPSGTGTNPFTGMQNVTGTVAPVNGTFTYY